MNLDHYKTLNVAYDATQEDIKKSFKKLAMKHHPDRNINNDSDIMFKKINEAYSILSDIVKKKYYDESLNINQFKEENDYNDDIKEEKIQNFIININFWDSIKGFNSSFNFNVLSKYGNIVNVNAKVKIPPLVNEGDVFEISFEDSYFNITIHIINDTNFTRNNMDLISHIDIPLHVALIGGTIKFSYLENIFNVNLEGGLSQGQSIKIANGGIKKDIFSGDLILNCNIIFPNKLSERQKELISEFADIEISKKTTTLSKILNFFKKP